MKNNMTHRAGKCIIYSIFIFMLSCGNSEPAKLVDLNYNRENHNRENSSRNEEFSHQDVVEDERMVLCPICMGNGAGIFFDVYQICPACSGNKYIPQRWIDEANQYSAEIGSWNNTSDLSNDRRQYIESEIARLESDIYRMESSLANCSSSVLSTQYQNQITNAQYEIRRLQMELAGYQ